MSLFANCFPFNRCVKKQSDQPQEEVKEEHQQDVKNTLSDSHNRGITSPNGKRLSLYELPPGFRPGVHWHTPLLRGNIMFGRYPFQDEVEQLQQAGITMFLDLTEKDESYKNLVLEPYQASSYFHFPIKEQSIPDDVVAFRALIRQLCQRLKKDENERIYIHCKHGRGRSGMVALILIAICHSLSYDKALSIINTGHAYGHGSGSHWRGRIIPPHKNQHTFAHAIIGSWKNSYEQVKDK